MSAWWAEISAFQQVLFVIGCATTLIMLIQVAMVFIGGVSEAGFEHGDMHGDFHGDCSDSDSDAFNESGFGMIFGLRLLSVRSFLAFFAIGSWVTFIFCDVLPNAIWGAVFLGIVAGLFAAVLVAFLIKSMESLQQNGAVEIKNAVGKPAEVYLTIPAQRGGNGKVNVFVQERYVEYEAVTDDNEPLKTGDKARVVSIFNDGTLVVTKN